MVGDGCMSWVDDRRYASTLSWTASCQGGKIKTTGVLERKADATYISREVVIGKEAY